MELRHISNTVAVITGASIGIGQAAARALVKEGVNVVLASRSRDKIMKLAEELGKRATAKAVNVANADAVQRLFVEVKEQFGGVDLLFNNAGVGYYNPFEKSTRDEWQEMIDANLYGLLNCTQAAIPLMRGRRGAMICSVASVAGRHGMPGFSVYSATKFAVVGFHDALRKELGESGIRVSLIEPGAVYTNWGYNVPDEKMKERRDGLEALHAEDVAGALVYAYAQPGNVNLQELLIMPTRQVVP